MRIKTQSLIFVWNSTHIDTYLNDLETNAPISVWESTHMYAWLDTNTVPVHGHISVYTSESVSMWFYEYAKMRVTVCDFMNMQKWE